MFSFLFSKKEVKSIAKAIALKADRSLIDYIIQIAQGHNLKMANILPKSTPLLPWALLTSYRLLRKTNRVTLATWLPDNVTEEENLSDTQTFK